MAVQCQCGVKRAAQLNTRLYVDGNRVVYVVVYCDTCLAEQEKLGLRLHRVAVRPADKGG